jgi:hypothetical protein
MKTKFCPITGVEGIVKVQNLENVKPPFANTDKFRDMFFTPAYVGSIHLLLLIFLMVIDGSIIHLRNVRIIV